MAILHKFRTSLQRESKAAGGRKSRSLMIDDSKPLSGVFVNARALEMMMDDVCSCSSTTSGSSASSSVVSRLLSWSSSGGKTHHRGSPAVAPSLNRGQTDKAKVLEDVMRRNAQLPSTSYFSSEHILTNQERSRRTIAPLVRLRLLDAIARAHAEQMASEGEVRHIKLEALQAALPDSSFERLGENSQRGRSIRSIHAKMMGTASNKNNIVDRRYTHFGCGTAVGEDGSLYLCQVFQG